MTTITSTGTEPVAVETPEKPPPGISARILTAVIVLTPLVALGWAADRFWHRGIGWLDFLLAAAFYLITGFGITLGFHRLFTHRSFRARRGLRICLAIAGSMAVEGSVISWVSHHRRHHVYADGPGDPHSPQADGHGLLGKLRGLVHGHVGWLFRGETTNADRWCRDLQADPDMVMVSNLTPLWVTLSLMLPFGIGWVATRSLTGALLALLWAGGVRVALLHHVTWSVNSLGHLFGKRPYATSDRSGNIGLLAIVSFGDSWHNSHHAFPALARHGCDRGQLDSSAALLKTFVRLGWASHARWPTTSQLARRRVAG
jgi:stearoyl-CoA desaturase (Delta-9 desaturase)